VFFPLIISLLTQAPAVVNQPPATVFDDPRVRAAASTVVGMTGHAAYWLGVCDRVLPLGEQNAHVNVVLSANDLRQVATVMMAARATAAASYAQGRTAQMLPTPETCKPMQDNALRERNAKVQELMLAIADSGS
jgi:hypothetical protein